MDISDHRILGREQRNSPHADSRPDESDINLLVIHGISLPAGQFGGSYIDDLFMGCIDCTADESFAPLEGIRVSAHCVIRRNGEVLQYVPFNKRAWHAGISNFDGREKCNDFSIGIELEGTDTTPYTDFQYEQLAELAVALMRYYPQITLDRIVGHEHIAPGRKTDPGVAFKWSHFFNCVEHVKKRKAE